MVKALVLAALIGAFVSSDLFACDGSCVTVFKVVDCENAPVEGATVTVACKSGGTVTATTGDNGLAEVRVCTHDIKRVDVTAQIVQSKAAACAKSPCVIKLCFESSEDIPVT